MNLEDLHSLLNSAHDPYFSPTTRRNAIYTLVRELQTLDRKLSGEAPRRISSEASERALHLRQEMP